MNRLDDIYKRATDSNREVEEYIYAYESMIMESYPDGNHEEWMRYKGICEELVDEVENIVNRVES